MFTIANLEFADLISLFKQTGEAGLVIGLMVLLFVYVGYFTDVFKNGNMKRLAAIIAAYLFAGNNPTDPDFKNILIGAIGLLSATVAKILVEFLLKFVGDMQAQAKKK